MELLQRAIEDERKSRLADIFQTEIGSLGCGLTMSWSGRLAADPEARLPDMSQGAWRELCAVNAPSILVELTRRTPHSPGYSETVRYYYGRLGVVMSRPSTSTTHHVALPSSPVGAHRERELEWRHTHARELRQYENQWVVLEGEEIIAHSPEAAQAIRQAKSRGIRTPYIFFVEAESDESVKIGL